MKFVTASRLGCLDLISIGDALDGKPTLFQRFDQRFGRPICADIQRATRLEHAVKLLSSLSPVDAVGQLPPVDAVRGAVRQRDLLRARFDNQVVRIQLADGLNRKCLTPRIDDDVPRFDIHFSADVERKTAFLGTSQRIQHPIELVEVVDAVHQPAEHLRIADMIEEPHQPGRILRSVQQGFELDSATCLGDQGLDLRRFQGFSKALGSRGAEVPR